MKTKLSSGTWLVKRVLPAFGILFVVVLVLGLFGLAEIRGSVMLAAAFCVVFNAIVFYYAFKTKDVWLDKDHLVVKSGNKEERIDLADVASVSGGMLGNYRSVRVTFSTTTAFGRSILFWSGYHFFSIGRNEAADGLRKMVSRRKAKRAAEPSMQAESETPIR